MNTKELISCDECCGCRLCEENCPQKAISMTQGELGLLFPQIDAVKCVDCHLCTRLCPQRKDLQQDTKAVFAAVNTRKSALLASASGGAFSAIARAVLNQDGIVYGAAMLQDEKDILKVRHIRVDSIEQLHLLQGSKYLQSDMSGIYSALKADMKEGKTVLFSGTPCQVAAVKSQCGEAEKLILAEIICHGIPSQTLFTDYLKILRGKGKRIEAFIKYNKSNISINFLGIAISSKIAKAVKRNKIKRLIRESYKSLENNIDTSNSIVFLWKKKVNIEEATYENIKKDIEYILKKANIFIEEE